MLYTLTSAKMRALATRQGTVRTMNEFKTYHPIVNFTYFLFVIGFSCFFMHPVYLAISLVCGFTYSVILKGKRALKTNLLYVLPILILMSIMNPLFNHEGITVLTYLPSGNPLTLESIIYGFGSAAMIVSVIFHFSCFNEIMTSDKIIYLFGRIIPSTSLIISMTLRFVPRFSAQLKIVVNAQKCIGRDISGGNIVNHAKHALEILSIMTTWALENSVETADSMKSRGYGIPGRTSFSVFKFDTRDKKAFILILFFGIYTLTGHVYGETHFEYFPSIQITDISLYGISIFMSYFILCMYPVIIEILEARKWNALKSKI